MYQKRINNKNRQWNNNDKKRISIIRHHIFRFFKRTFLVSLGYIISATVLFATPSVHLFSPDIHTRSQKPLVLFKGKVENTESLTINGHPVEIYNNRFYIKAILHPHQTNIFTLKAANNYQETTILTRKVDYFPENIQETTIDYIKPNPPKDDILHNKWHITGQVQDVKSLYIQGKEIPIQENNLLNLIFKKNKIYQT